MDMHVFQVESNKVLPQQGSILISSPFMNDYHFTRAVVLLIEHNDEGSTATRQYMQSMTARPLRLRQDCISQRSFYSR